jgi:sulfide dehydrogenase cytochrome subunit
VKQAIRTTLFLLALTLPAAAHADAAALARNCAHCHGLAGTSGGNRIPNIGGQREQYLRHVLLEFKRGNRLTLFMERLAKGYSDQELEAVATYFARLPWSPSTQATDPRLVERGAQLAEARCARCHGDSGQAGSGIIPLIAGQWVEYLQDELAKFMDPQMQTPNPGMLNAMTGLGDTDIEALAHYYASQGPGAARP